MESLRSCNVFDISEVQFAIVETTGKISVYSKFPYRNVTNHDIGISGTSSDPPCIIINDGIFLGKAFSVLNLEKKWLDDILHKKQLHIKDIFLMTADKNGNYNIIEKEL